MTKFILFILVFLLTAQTVNSQFHFLKRGRIVFERKINTYAIITDFVVESNLVQVTELNAYLQNYKSNNSQFWIDSFQLFFDSIQTFYEPIGAVSKFLHGVGTQTSHANKVFSNLSSTITISEKYAHNEIFLIKDSVKKIKWKLTDEVLDIAGFECRRANAIIMDSIYIVAFYTDAIQTKGGPESFWGLPGMILGVALPHYHINYFAKRVDVLLTPFTNPEFYKPFDTGNELNQHKFEEKVLNFFKNFNQFNRWTQIFMNL